MASRPRGARRQRNVPRRLRPHATHAVPRRVAAGHHRRRFSQLSCIAIGPQQACMIARDLARSIHPAWYISIARCIRFACLSDGTLTLYLYTLYLEITIACSTAALSKEAGRQLFNRGQAIFGRTHGRAGQGRSAYGPGTKWLGIRAVHKAEKERESHGTIAHRGLSSIHHTGQAEPIAIAALQDRPGDTGDDPCDVRI
nr:unnamed protein product [Digitaria exilis]